MQNKRNGKGFFTFPDGRTYEGQLSIYICLGGYKDDLKEGKGKFSWPNGDIYDGQWRKGLQDGRGTLMKGNGIVLIGEWRNGEIIHII